MVEAAEGLHRGLGEAVAAFRVQGHRKEVVLGADKAEDRLPGKAGALLYRKPGTPDWKEGAGPLPGP